jgi:hypothetical protein
MEQRSTASERRRALKNASPQELLEQGPLNFAIHYNQISSARIIRSLFEWQLKFSFSGLGKIKMTTFKLQKNQINEVQRLLELVLTPAQFQK